MQYNEIQYRISCYTIGVWGGCWGSGLQWVRLRRILLDAIDVSGRVELKVQV